jgi:insulysin
MERTVANTQLCTLHRDNMSEETPIQPIHLPPIEQGQSDYRSYRPLLLPTANGDAHDGITVLLVNDPQSKHFAASVSVHSGASSDPRVLPGLAHFCEHSESR